MCACVYVHKRGLNMLVIGTSMYEPYDDQTIWVGDSLLQPFALATMEGLTVLHWIPPSDGLTREPGPEPEEHSIQEFTLDITKKSSLTMRVCG